MVGWRLVVEGGLLAAALIIELCVLVSLLKEIANDKRRRNNK